MCQSSKTIQPIIKTNQFSYAILLYARNGEQTWLGITKNHKKKKTISGEELLWCSELSDATFFSSEKEGIEIADLITTPGLLFYKSIRFSVDECCFILRSC